MVFFKILPVLSSFAGKHYALQTEASKLLACNFAITSQLISNYNQAHYISEYNGKWHRPRSGTPFTFPHLKTGHQCSFRYSSTFGKLDGEKVDEEKAFNDVFPIIVDDFTNYLSSRNLHEVTTWFPEVLKYNVPHGKKNRGMAVLSTFKILKDNANSEQLHVARIVGWCLEIVQAYFLVSDDIMDQSTTRRGQPCWYKKDNVGMTAVNDGVMLYACIYHLLTKYIQDKECSSSIENCFQEVVWLTSIGQCLDMLSAQNSGRPDLQKYTYERYSTIVHYKTSYYSFCLPVRLALVLAGMKHAYTPSVEDLLLTFGHFFQVQDDYLDCFGDPAITGKVGTDIEVGKCSWPIVTAMSRVNSADRKILETNYGVPDAKCSQKIRDVYSRIGLKELYAQYETETYRKLCEQIEEVSKVNGIPQDIFYSILSRFHNRNK